MDELKKAWSERFPDAPLRATAAQMDRFEQEFGPIPDDFRWVLENLGGGGNSVRLCGIAALPLLHKRVRRESALPGDLFAVGVDPGGNPVGVSSTGLRLAGRTFPLTDWLRAELESSEPSPPNGFDCWLSHVSTFPPLLHLFKDHPLGVTPLVIRFFAFRMADVHEISADSDLQTVAQQRVRARFESGDAGRGAFDKTFNWLELAQVPVELTMGWFDTVVLGLGRHAGRSSLPLFTTGWVRSSLKDLEGLSGGAFRQNYEPDDLASFRASVSLGREAFRVNLY